MTSLPGYDSWLGGYDRYPIEAWCVNRDCPNHEQSVTVMYEKEYGMGTITPEECPDCGSILSTDGPRPDDDEDEEDE